MPLPCVDDLDILPPHSGQPIRDAASPVRASTLELKLATAPTPAQNRTGLSVVEQKLAHRRLPPREFATDPPPQKSVRFLLQLGLCHGQRGFGLLHFLKIFPVSVALVRHPGPVATSLGRARAASNLRTRALAQGNMASGSRGSCR